MYKLITILLVIFAMQTGTAASIKVFGHRGARATRPENTLSAFEYAIDVGADYLELDVNVTKDNKLVVFHDPRVNKKLCLLDGKTLEKDVPFSELTLKQVKKYDCGSLKNPRFPNQILKSGEKIPTLAEVFDLVKKSKHSNAKSIGFNIETKIFPYEPKLTPTPKRFAQLLIAQINKSNMLSRTVIQSFDHRTLKWAKKLSPKIRTSQLTYESLVDLTSAAKSIKAEYVSPHWKWITGPTVKDLHKSKIKVIPWTANTIESWEYLVSINVDGIITDDPKALIEFLKKKGKR